MESPLNRRRYVLYGALLIFIIVGTTVWTLAARKWGHATPPSPLPIDEQATLVVVNKAARRLDLFHDSTLLASYPISLGQGADKGPKQREGDKKTPAGRYVIDGHNAKSKFSLSLHISYPDNTDRERARSGGYAPGGDIMIHGQPNGWGWFKPLFQRFDWTDGCIAVTNSEMQEIWARVPVGTPILIEK